MSKDGVSMCQERSDELGKSCGVQQMDRVWGPLFRGNKRSSQQRKVGLAALWVWTEGTRARGVV